MKTISIIGSTGSIGTQTLSVAAEHGDIKVCAISGGHNIGLLEKQIRQFDARLASCADEADAIILRERLSDTDVKILSGMEGLIAVACADEADMVVTAVVGMLGIRPTIAAIKAGKDIALANKETLVCAGSIIMPMAREYGVSILPVDSEHSAIFQSLQGNSKNDISRILLTASGGPFRGRTMDELSDVTVEDALAHPNWAMGKKITIDSATMFNKGLEVIEACHLFGVSPDRIEVVVHPQSIIHSAVEYEDGSVIAQLGLADMRLPIQYALYYPNRRPLSGDRLDLFKIASLSFERPDMETFYGLALAFDAFEAGGNVCTVMNAANEFAVGEFLDGRISFLDIPRLVGDAMQGVDYIADPSIEDIYETERLTNEFCRKWSRIP